MTGFSFPAVLPRLPMFHRITRECIVVIGVYSSIEVSILII